MSLKDLNPGHELAAVADSADEAKEWIHLGGQDMLASVDDVLGSIPRGLDQKQTLAAISEGLDRLRDPEVSVHQCQADDIAG